MSVCACLITDSTPQSNVPVFLCRTASLPWHVYLSVYFPQCSPVSLYPCVSLVSYRPRLFTSHLFALVLVLCSVSEISFPYASFSVPVLCVLVSQVLCAPLCMYTSVSVYQYLVLLPLHFCVSDTCNRAYVCVKYLFMPVCLCVLVAMYVFLCLYES